MKRIIILLLLSISSTVYSQTAKDTIWNELSRFEDRLVNLENKNLGNEIALLRDRVDYQLKVSERSNNSISTQLDSASYVLTLFGILFAIAAIGLGIYVTYVERKIVKIGEENKLLLIKNQRIKDDVEALNKLIQNDIYGLFLKIKREESVHILDRLIKVPKDIANVCDALLSRDLHEEDFLKLKKAYLNLQDKSDGSYEAYYLILFFQHFLGESLRDESLRKDIAEDIPSSIQAAFENDIEKSTTEFTTILLDKGMQEFKFEINQFFKGFANSQFKDYIPIYKIIYEGLKSRKNRFELFSIIESAPEMRSSKIQYGNLLHDNYSTDNPTESEKLAFGEWTKLIEAKRKEDDEKKQKEDERKKQQEEREKQRLERKRKLDELKNKTTKDKDSEEDK